MITFKKPYFGASADDFGYAWYDEDEEIIQFPAKLYLPGATEAPEDPDTYAEAITLSESSHKGIVGDEFTLTATLMPAAVTDPTIAWKSSNPEVAAVDENGKVTLLKEGEAVISAKCKVVKATCAVTVEESAGISDVAADAAEAEYYSVDGVRLQSAPAHGIYIKLQGGKATKMIAK